MGNKEGQSEDEENSDESDTTSYYSSSEAMESEESSHRKKKFQPYKMNKAQKVVVDQYLKNRKRIGPKIKKRPEISRDEDREMIEELRDMKVPIGLSPRGQVILPSRKIIR